MCELYPKVIGVHCLQKIRNPESREGGYRFDQGSQVTKHSVSPGDTEPAALHSGRSLDGAASSYCNRRQHGLGITNRVGGSGEIRRYF